MTTKGRIPRDTLLRMLRREEELRMSDETQQLYDKSGPYELPPFSIEDDIQHRVLTEFGYDPVADLEEYRYTHGLYLDDPGTIFGHQLIDLVTHAS